MGPAPVRLEGIHAAMTIARPGRGVVLVAIEGHDTGELGDAPFHALREDLARGGELALFIDARAARTASIEVSGAWAQWLEAHRDRLSRIEMLAGSRFVRMSAEHVRRFAGLGERMRLHEDPAAFDAALAAAVAAARAEVRFEGAHATITIARPAHGVVVVTLAGHDTGEFGDAPFDELAADLARPERIALFIDARAGRGASIHVSGSWARWLATHRGRLASITMLTGSRLIEVSAAFVRDFAELGESMRLLEDPAAFDAALARAGDGGGSIA